MDIAARATRPLIIGTVTGALRLTPTQEVQWEEMCAESPTNPGASRNLVMDCRVFQGPLDVAGFDAAVASVMRRHDALRLVFDEVGLDPVLRVRDDVAAPLSRHDVREAAEGKEEAANRLVWQMFTTPFDPTTEPMWRITVVRTDEAQHLVAVLFSHVIADGYSCDVFYRDLVAHYAGTAEQLLPAPGLPEIMGRQHERYPVTPERLAFWRRQIGGLFEVPGLLPDQRPPQVDVLRREYLHFTLPSDCVLGLRRTAWQARTTPFLTLLAAYHLALSLVTGKRTTVIVTSTTGRRDALDRAAVFQLASYPYVVLEVNDDDTLLQLARRAHASLQDAIDNLVPYTELAAAANPCFSSSRPWPDVNLIDGTFHSWPDGGEQIVAPGLVVNQVPNPVPPPSEMIAGDQRAVPPTGDLPPGLAGCRPGLTVSLERDRCVVFFNDQLYSEAAMARLSAAFTWLAEMFASAPDATVNEVADEFQQKMRGIDPEEQMQ